MGYTNYYYQERDFTDKEWDMVKEESKYVQELGYKVERYASNGKGVTTIVINGDCEPLVLSKYRRTKKNYEDDNLSFNFCKTRMAQYDLAVWYLLCSCNQLLGEDFRISRDR